MLALLSLVNKCYILERKILNASLFFARRCWLLKDEEDKEDGGKRWMLQEEDDKDLEGEFSFCF